MFSSYIWILVWCGISTIFMKSSQFMQLETVNGERVWRMKKWAAVLVFVPLIFMVTNRGWIGDTYTYYRNYFNSPSSFSELFAYASTLQKDKGFYIFTAILRIILGGNYRMYFFLLVAIQSYFLIKIYRKYSVHYTLSFFLFITSTDYISWMYNGIRQFLAVTIVFGAFNLILNKKYVKAAIIIGIASLFHGTALLMIPFMFICRGKAWNKKTLCFIAIVVFALAFVGRFTSILDMFLKDTQYSNVVTDITVGDFSNDDGTNPLRVLVYSVPTIIAFIYRKRIQEKNDSVISLCVNMSIVSTGLYLISMVTSGIMMGRLPIYFSLYNYILLPWEVDNLFVDGNKRIVKLALVVFYLLYYYYSIHIQLGLI